MFAIFEMHVRFIVPGEVSLFFSFVDRLGKQCNPTFCVSASLRLFDSQFILHRRDAEAQSSEVGKTRAKGARPDTVATQDAKKNKDEPDCRITSAEADLRKA